MKGKIERHSRISGSFLEGGNLIIFIQHCILQYLPSIPVFRKVIGSYFCKETWFLSHFSSAVIIQYIKEISMYGVHQYQSFRQKEHKECRKKTEKGVIFLLPSLKVIGLQCSQPLEFIFYDVPAANSPEHYADPMITNVSGAPLSSWVTDQLLIFQ